MVNKPEDYIWSSYSMYIGERKGKLINSKEILNHFTDETYKSFVERRMSTLVPPDQGLDEKNVKN